MNDNGNKKIKKGEVFILSINHCGIDSITYLKAKTSFYIKDFKEEIKSFSQSKPFTYCDDKGCAGYNYCFPKFQDKCPYCGHKSKTEFAKFTVFDFLINNKMVTEVRPATVYDNNLEYFA